MNNPYGVYLITQSNLSDGRSTPEVVEAAVAGGVDVVQLREKHLDARSRCDLGRELRALTAESDVSLVVNDRVDVAQAIDADGVHLGDDDLSVETARDLLGPDAVVGRSVSTVEAARRAEAAGADYLGVGAVFHTDSKDTSPEQTAIGLDRVAAITEAVDVPFVGVGGITRANARDVVEAGADGVAVITAITKADDPETATAALRREVTDGV